MNKIMVEVNTQFSAQLTKPFTTETFRGTNFYKFYYAIAQVCSQGETISSETFAKLQQYFAITNEKIDRPVVTNPGIVEKMESYTSELLPDGLIVSVKPMIDDDAGKINICVDIDDDGDDYDAQKIEICTLISQITCAGTVTQGSESESIVLSNTQAFDFKYCLPDETPIKWKLTTTLSENNTLEIGDPDDTKALLFANINAKYRIGKDVEPQTYFSIADAPWNASVVLEYSVDGGSTWLDDIIETEFDDKYTFELADIELVEE